MANLVYGTFLSNCIHSYKIPNEKCHCQNLKNTLKVL